MGDFQNDAKGDLPPYEQDLPDYSKYDHDGISRSIQKFDRLVSQGSRLPPQDHPDFPFNLPSTAQAYLKFHETDSDVFLVVPSDGTKENPLYTMKRYTSRSITKKYHTDLFRNQDRRPDWYDPERPVATARVHSNSEHVDFHFNRADGTEISLKGATHHDMFDTKKSFAWPAAVKDPQRYKWVFPGVPWSLTGAGDEAPWLYARLHQVDKDGKVTDEKQSIVDVLIWSATTGLDHEKSFIRIAMHEILDGGHRREDQIQRMDDVVIVAVAFCAGKMRSAMETSKHLSGSNSSSHSGILSALAGKSI